MMNHYMLDRLDSKNGELATILNRLWITLWTTLVNLEVKSVILTHYATKVIL